MTGVSGRALPEGVDDLEPVHLGHADVGDHQVGRLAGVERRDRLPAVGERRHLVPGRWSGCGRGGPGSTGRRPPPGCGRASIGRILSRGRGELERGRREEEGEGGARARGCSTSMRPRSAPAISREMARPRPGALARLLGGEEGLEDVLARVRGDARRRCRCTESASWSPARRARTVRLPLPGMASTALEMKLPRTWRTSEGSMLAGPRSAGTSRRTSMRWRASADTLRERASSTSAPSWTGSGPGHERPGRVEEAPDDGGHPLDLALDDLELRRACRAGRRRPGPGAARGRRWR